MHAEQSFARSVQALIAVEPMTAAVAAQPRALVADDVEVRPV